MTSSDRIEKVVRLRAPVSRVWRAIADAEEFGQWFGFRFLDPFVAGREVRGEFLGTVEEASLIAYQKKVGVKPSALKLPPPGAVFCTIEAIEPERYFSFRWVPYGIDAEADPQTEPKTLVEFRLEPVPEGTLLTIVESGFDRVPAHRRERAFRMNEGGWAAQAANIEKYVDAR